MRLARYLLLAAILAVPMSALAHGGGEHLMGVVKAIDAKGLAIETRDKKEAHVVFDEKTKFEKAGEPSSARELTVGERVVVHTTKKDGVAEPIAVLVKWGAKQR